MNKRLLIAALVAGGLVPSVSRAALLLPGGFLEPVPAGTETGTLVISTGALPFTTATTSGTGTESVYRETNGTLSFVYSVSNSAASLESDRSITMSDFAPSGVSYSTDVVYVAGTGVVPTDATRGALNGGHAIGFDFYAPGPQNGNGEIVPGGSSDTLVIHTNATSYQTGTFSVQDGTAASMVGFGPAGSVPEPTTLAAMSLVGLALASRRR